MKSLIIKQLCKTTLVVLIAFLSGCVHEQILENPSASGSDPADMSGPVNTDTVTFNVNTVACDDQTVYFNTQILPIFAANCAISGCHNAASHREGLVLDSYQGIMKKITPGKLSDSKNYRVLLASGEDLMPRKPGTERGYSLPSEQITLIKTWILQGAKNNFCDGCDDTDFRFSTKIAKIFEYNCATSSACHAAGSGNGILTSYNNIKAYVDAELIQKRVVVFNNMPPAAPLADCDRLLIKKWIDDGAKNN